MKNPRILTGPGVVEFLRKNELFATVRTQNRSALTLGISLHAMPAKFSPAFRAVKFPHWDNHLAIRTFVVIAL